MEYEIHLSEHSLSLYFYLINCLLHGSGDFLLSTIRYYHLLFMFMVLNGSPILQLKLYQVFKNQLNEEIELINLIKVLLKYSYIFLIFIVKINDSNYLYIQLLQGLLFVGLFSRLPTRVVRIKNHRFFLKDKYLQ